jgi:hypothetical protein
MAVLLSMAGPLTFLTGALGVIREPSTANIAKLASWWLAYGMVLACLLLAGGYLLMFRADALGPSARRPLWVAAAFLAAFVTNTLTAGRAAVILEQGLAYSSMTMQAHGFIVSFTMALLYFTHLSRSREQELAAEHLVVAQAARRNTSRRIAQIRLQEMQARIDPQMLFQMLDIARRLFEADPVRAERFLDELIVFLRASLRRLRSPSSSLAREAELARAFVGLHALAGARELDLATDISVDAGAARFPPGVLLPLLDSALANGDDRLHLAAHCAVSTTCVELTSGKQLSEETVERVRNVLREASPTPATLETDATDGIVRTVIRFPHEPA